MNYFEHPVANMEKKDLPCLVQMVECGTLTHCECIIITLSPCQCFIRIYCKQSQDNNDNDDPPDRMSEKAGMVQRRAKTKP